MSPRWSAPTRAKSSGPRAPPSPTTSPSRARRNFYKHEGKHLITVKTEHKAVLDTMRELERQGFEVHLSRRRAQRPARPREVQGGDPPRHDPGLGHVRQQRNRRDPGHRGDRRDVPRARHHLPRRRGAGHRQGRHRPADAEGRPDDLLRAQDLRPEGHRRAVRAPQAARAHRSADARRRSRARHALGHAADAPDRRHGRGVPHRQAKRWRRNERIRALRDRLWPGLSEHRRGLSSTATWNAACRTT